MISYLNRTYTQNLMHACDYNDVGTIATSSVGDQWTRGLITKLKEIPIFDSSNSSLFQESVQGLYDNDQDQSIPSSFHLVAGFQPELYSFMRYKLGFTEEETYIE